MELNISLEWNWIKNHFSLSLLIVNRTRCPSTLLLWWAWCGARSSEVFCRLRYSRYQSYRMGLKSASSGGYFWEDARLGPGSAGLIISRWQPQQTRPLPDLTTQTQARRRSWGQPETWWPGLAWAYSYITGSTSHHTTEQLNNSCLEGAGGRMSMMTCTAESSIDIDYKIL